MQLTRREENSDVVFVGPVVSNASGDAAQANHDIIRLKHFDADLSTDGGNTFAPLAWATRELAGRAQAAYASYYGRSAQDFWVAGRGVLMHTSDGGASFEHHTIKGELTHVYADHNGAYVCGSEGAWAKRHEKKKWDANLKAKKRGELARCLWLTEGGSVMCGHHSGVAHILSFGAPLARGKIGQFGIAPKSALFAPQVGMFVSVAAELFRGEREGAVFSPVLNAGADIAAVVSLAADLLVFAGQAIHRSTDRGATWTAEAVLPDGLAFHDAWSVHGKLFATTTDSAFYQVTL